MVHLPGGFFCPGGFFRLSSDGTLVEVWDVSSCLLGFYVFWGGIFLPTGKSVIA